eukprot:TRINITY_DN9222_c0_g1_i1.p1 TRINITY_DN9222_c0_g1~~TRINITY_DN9222_c0_g1_i1.p1  ORF type:complete len:364 (+),score=78.90 TRINITY_DN9222_c0_g1_i1:73-1164(+)
MTSELAAPMYVRVPPGVERLQVQCAGSIFLSSLDLKAPPGLLWSPGQLLKAIISGSGYSNGMTQAAPLNHVADVQKTTPLLDEAPLNHVADVQMTSPLVDDMKLAGRPDAAPDNLPSVPVPRAETAEFEDRIGLEAALVPALRNALAKDQDPDEAHAGKRKGARWWTCPEQPLLCPLSGFPICLLPYPPFKLRVDARRSGRYRLVDGRFLAMRMIATGCRDVCGRELQASDLCEVDDYMHRCKLGPCRPGRAAALEKTTREATDPAHRAEAKRDLDSMVIAARAELDKLKRIQENRLLQVNRKLPAHAQAAMKNMRTSLLSEIDSSPAVSKRCTACKRGRLPSFASVSTQEVSSSGASEASHE